MGNFTKEFKKTYDFDGDSVEITMSRLKRKDALSLMPYMEKNNDGDIVMRFQDQIQFIDVISDMLPNYVKAVRGLYIEGKEALLSDQEFKDEFFSEIYFMPLMTSIVGDLMKESFITNKESVAIKKPQPNTSTDLPPIGNS